MSRSPLSGKQASSLSQEDIVTNRKVSRRTMALLGSVGVGSASALALLGATGCCFGGMPGGGCSDRDPSDGLGRGTHCVSTGCSDNDPSDPMGSGRSCVASGCSDRDPSDPAGSGRSCGGAPPAAAPTPPQAPPVGGTTP